MTDRKRETGSVLRVPLGRGRYGFGRLLKGPMVEFFDVLQLGSAAAPTFNEIVGAPVLFRVSVMNAAVNRWKEMGVLPLTPEEQAAVHRFGKQDSISGKLTIFWTNFTGEFGEVPATLEQCLELETAAVWTASHIQERLHEHFEGRSSSMVQSLAPRDPAEWRLHRFRWLEEDTNGDLQR